MDYIITYHGVPVGALDELPPGERVTVPVRPLAGYEPLRALVRAASEAQADLALGQSVEARVLERGAALGRTLELRDGAGALLPTDFIELTDWPGGSPELAAFIRLRDAHAPVPARLAPYLASTTGALWPEI